MATARVPIAETIWDIDISPSYVPSEPGPVIGPTDKIEFTNLAPHPIQIVFIVPPNYSTVFNNTGSISTNGTSPQQQAQQTQVTADYWVVDLTTKMSYGPYSIEVGINTNNVPAPLPIPITNGEPPTDPDMSTLAVPVAGWVQFHYLDQGYTLTWNPSNAFTGPTNADSMNPIYEATDGNQVTSANYNLVSQTGVAGVGTVKIRS